MLTLEPERLQNQLATTSKDHRRWKGLFTRDAQAAYDFSFSASKLEVIYRSESWTNGNVWSAALSQAKNESDRMVCANVFGLRWSTKLLALMECAARSSHLVMQPWKAFPVYRFRERRVRPLCHLIVRQQTWQQIINSVVAAGL
jgi:hypothetical protein